MDKLFTLILYVLLISSLIGIMDKVKHKWETTWFSTLKKPKWLINWLNPHALVLFKIKPVWLAYIFRYPLAAIADFWHCMKGIMLQLIWIAIWTGYHESNIWVWLLICNCGYMVFFELFNAAMFNKK